MRILGDIFMQTLRTLWAHKLRSFLTMFGIAWGVGSLLLLVGVGEGFRSGQRRELNNIGENIMFIFGGRVPAVPGSSISARPYELTYDDYLAIRDNAKAVLHISPILSRGDISAVSDYTSTNGEVFGVVPEYNQIRTINMGPGRWLNEEDNAQHRRVVVMGSEMGRNLFPGRPVVGNTITLNNVSFEVVGVLVKIGKEGNSGTNLRFFVPVNTMRDLFRVKGDNKYDAISFINYQPLTTDGHELAKQQVHEIIAQRHNFDWHNKDAFNEWDTIENMKTVGKIFDVMDWFLGGVGLVTLGLGAIGIINIMLVSVTERTKEIGLRKALGATNKNVLTQFFLEGAFLTLLSGGGGLAVAAGVMALLSTLPQPEGFDTPQLVPTSAALAIISLALCGIVAGLYPARKAAMMTPVEALRSE
ncbi:MAG TPA: ABC transporter permease [Terriglobales bacterium]|jgi:putative ABC transport system permease protein|nr:ABC transporter permease [Terriglobales bacterium]